MPLETILEKYFPALLAKLPSGGDQYEGIKRALEALDAKNLSWARLNQTLHRLHEAGMSEGFYRYYFLSTPREHPYPVDRIFREKAFEPPPSGDAITTPEQFEWGIRRFIYDAMLYWGNFRQAYRDLRGKSHEEIAALFRTMRVDDGRLHRRGRVEGPTSIAIDSRYLISEMASRSFVERSDIKQATHVGLAVDAFRSLQKDGIQATPEALEKRTKEFALKHKQASLCELMYEQADHVVSSEAEVVALYSGQHEAFKAANRIALENTKIYLSLCNDLDIYVATSMRTRKDFRDMAETCGKIFSAPELSEYNLRYFDPTLSAAEYHEDKGIVECLMVKTAKVVIYFAQNRESLGKVSEYAMGLSLGKPVIVLCPDDSAGREMADCYRNSHPLMRLIEFSTGIVNGAMVTCSVKTVIELIKRILDNRMEYELTKREGSTAYFFLRERTTESSVRVMTDNKLLTETFWNNWHGLS